MDIIFTVCNRHSLAHALVLAESVRKYHPERVFWLGWVDSLVLTGISPGINILAVTDVQMAAWPQMEQNYYPFELVPACRPWFALHILNNNPQCTSLTFLAPTVRIFGPLHGIINPDAAFVLTPNISKPLPEGQLLDDKRILNTGMFHAGSWSLRPQENTLAALQWWAERTADRASYDLCNAMATDQLWLNYVPVWIHDAAQVEHPGWHYGLHAVLNKNLSQNGEQWTVDGERLISVDFAGLDFFDPLWSDYKPLLFRNTDFKSLFAAYRKEVGALGHLFPGDKKPGFGKAVHIAGNRLTRRKLVRQLKVVTDFIDEL
ncbi:hypothetical protein [Dyadobacter sandarakinus]|uniref:Uncharacterized protein n=1 Tax=Dyadobacter sandarakinus TaxID=2747268 RepID=A0ABX7IF73_9BACT|nr:hypothetical protein [Dyadobacter sandarakinus]QRR03738.1 hypothetical protein HWI92_23890 [Dyadobacter sandarakinus]